MQHIIFCDINPGLENQVKEQLLTDPKIVEKYRVKAFTGSIKKIRVNTTYAVAYVSPANSFGTMAGGVDAVYRDMFPGITDKLSELVEPLGFKASFGENYLPVGSSVVVPCEEHDNVYLLSSPTMFTPEDISETTNIYKAMIATLKVVKKFNDNNDIPIKAIVVPGLGTGVGNVSFDRAVYQIKQALIDFQDDRGPVDNSKHVYAFVNEEAP